MRERREEGREGGRKGGREGGRERGKEGLPFQHVFHEGPADFFEHLLLVFLLIEGGSEDAVKGEGLGDAF